LTKERVTVEDDPIREATSDLELARRTAFLVTKTAKRTSP
jgi:hypothetical protein